MHQLSRIKKLDYHQSRCIRCKAIDIALCTSTSKIASYLITYPLESLKLISTSPTKERTTPARLYRGFLSYIPFCVFTNVATFHTFYFVKTLLVQYPLETYMCFILTSVITSLITSIYKIPYSFFLKNRIINNKVSFNGLYNLQTYPKAFAATMVEDVPDLCIKTLCVDMHAPILLATLTGLMMAPIELWKTRVLCHPCPINFSKTTIVLIMLISCTRMVLYLYGLSLVQ